MKITLGAPGSAGDVFGLGPDGRFYPTNGIANGEALPKKIDQLIEAIDRNSNEIQVLVETLIAGRRDL